MAISGEQKWHGVVECFEDHSDGEKKQKQTVEK